MGVYSTETTSRLLRAALPLEDAAVSEAVKRSRGNPLFALQQLHAWALQGNLGFSEGAYRVPPEVLAVRPKTTAELWDSRVAALPEEHHVAAYAGALPKTNVQHAGLVKKTLLLAAWTQVGGGALPVLAGLAFLGWLKRRRTIRKRARAERQATGPGPAAADTNSTPEEGDPRG